MGQSLSIGAGAGAKAWVARIALEGSSTEEDVALEDVALRDYIQTFTYIHIYINISAKEKLKIVKEREMVSKEMGQEADR